MTDPRELAAILLLHRQGWSVEDIVAALRRSRATIYRHLRELDRGEATRSD